ncbi:MAG: hypothetical protein ACI8W7_003500 [Gammaproteobacteria bacterium]|jgi:hypothetical protein
MTVELAPVDGPMVWGAKDMCDPKQWTHTLSPADSAELKSASAALQGRTIESLRKADFPLPALDLKLKQVRKEVLHGRGFAVLRGLDVKDAPLADIARIFWGIGSWFGEAISQNRDGQLLGHVTDIGARADHPQQRGFQSADALPFHTDVAGDLIALLCLRPAKTGGLSSVASAANLYNEMLRRHPTLLAQLLRPVSWDRRAEIPAGKLPWYELPIFSHHHGRLIVAFVYRFIVSAQEFTGAPGLGSLQREAIETLINLAAEETMHVSMDFQPGDIQLVNNLAVLHNRTAYTDHSPPDPPRHLLRLWLAADNAWPLPQAFYDRYPGRAANGRPAGIVIEGVEARARLDPRER